MSFFFFLFLFIATFILSELLRPSANQDETQPAGLGDFRFPSATENRSVPLIWGTVKIEGPNVVWYGDLSQQAITQTVKTGLFSDETVTTGFRYFIGVQFAWCRGPIDSLKRIWIGEEEVFNGTQGAGTLTIDEPELFGGDDLGNGGVQGDFSVFVGTEAQAASSYLSPFQQEGGDTPAYRGTAYGVFGAGYIGNSPSIKPWAFEVQRIPNGLGLTLGQHIVNGDDANPANVIYEVLTNDEWGLNFPAADIDVANFQTAGTTLFNEGNGFSMVLDRPTEMVEVLRILEKQIDGVVFLNRTTGKWQIKLVRDDYDIDTVPQVTSANLIAVEDFARGAWEDTVNHVHTSFNDRAKDYNGSFGQAHDGANIRIQGATVPLTQTYPGVKDAALANHIAWRDLRGLSTPLAKAKLVVDRTFFAVNPGEVVAFTGTIDDVSFTKFPFRISKVDLGQLADGKIVLDVVQDVFKFAQPSFGDPPPTGWDPPADNLVPFPADEQLGFEAPNAFIQRDPTLPGQRIRAWVAGRNQGDGAAVFDIRTRNAPSAPAGSFSSAGTVTAFMLVGELTNALSKSPNPNPETFIDIEATPSTKVEIQAAIGNVTAGEIGQNLSHLCLVGTEFIAFTDEGAAQPGGTVRLDNVYRGLLDSVPQDHPAGTKVYLIFVGGGLTDRSYPDFDDVDIKLLPRSTSDQVSEGSAIEIAYVGAIRDKKPYPPARLDLDGAVYPTTHNMDGGGGSLDDRGPDVDFIQRDFKTTDEVAALTTDGPNLDASTEYRMRVRNDPDGADTLLFTTDWGAPPLHCSRTKVLRETDGVQTSRLRVVIETRHDFESEYTDIEAIQQLVHDFDTTYADIADDTNLTKLTPNEVSPIYVAPDTGTYTFTIGSDVLTTGGVQARINGGAWTTVIATGMTTGTLAGVTAGDDIEVRHQQSFNIETFLQIDAPTSTTGAYAILVESGG